MSLFAFSAAIYFAKAAWEKRLSSATKSKSAAIQKTTQAQWMRFTVFIGLGALASGALFGVIYHFDATTIIQQYDNAFHLDTIQTMLNRGDWSCFVSTYLAHDGTACAEGALVNTEQFYPTAFHAICACCAQITGTSAVIAENAALLVLIMLVFPTSLFMLFDVLFCDNKRFVAFGGILCCAFITMPWALVFWGGSISNIAGLCLLPIPIILFVEIFSEKHLICTTLKCICLFLISILAIFCIHPGVVISAAVALIPFVIWQVARLSNMVTSGKISQKLTALLFGVLCALFIALIWKLVHDSPFMQGTVNFYWNADRTLNEVLKEIRQFSTCGPTTPQYGMSILCVLGILYAAIFNRKLLWLPCGLAVFVLIYIVCSCKDFDSETRSMLCGFWYNDRYRIAASYCALAIPLSFMGCLFIKEVVFRIAVRLSSKNTDTLNKQIYDASLNQSNSKVNEIKILSVIIVGVLSLALIVVNFLPVKLSEPKANKDGNVYSVLVQELNKFTLTDMRTQEKIDFLDKVSSILKPEEIVLNYTYDGSIWAYASNNINVFYKKFNQTEYQTDAAKQIRTSLASYTTNATTHEALQEIGAKYVLLLNDGSPDSQINYRYMANDWEGIASITPQTPGFEVVLNSGDMYLYRITDTK